MEKYNLEELHPGILSLSNDEIREILCDLSEKYGECEHCDKWVERRYFTEKIGNILYICDECYTKYKEKEMKYGNIIVYECENLEVRVGVLLDDSITVVYGDSLDSLKGKRIIKVYEGIKETQYKIK